MTKRRESCADDHYQARARVYGAGVVFILERYHGRLVARQRRAYRRANCRKGKRVSGDALSAYLWRLYHSSARRGKCRRGFGGGVFGRSGEHLRRLIQQHPGCRAEQAWQAWRQQRNGCAYAVRSARDVCRAGGGASAWFRGDGAANWALTRMGRRPGDGIGCFKRR